MTGGTLNGLGMVPPAAPGRRVSSSAWLTGRSRIGMVAALGCGGSGAVMALRRREPVDPKNSERNHTE
jgi:hypothetical protein